MAEEKEEKIKKKEETNPGKIQTPEKNNEEGIISEQIEISKPIKESQEWLIEARNFCDFYKKEFGQSIREGNVVLIDFNNIADFSHELAEFLIQEPEQALEILETALGELGLIKNPRIRLLDIPDTQHVKIRNLRAKHLNKLIKAEGIVRQSSEVRPQVINARFECPSCGTIISVLQIRKDFREPSRCSCGRKGRFRLISKDMIDAQRIVIEENPEDLSGGEQPRRMQVFLKEDLVEPKMEEKTTPGSKIKIIGVAKEIPIQIGQSVQTRFDLAIEANNIIPLEESFEELDISEEDEKEILELAADPRIFEKISESMAPSIYGYEEIKEVLALQLFGGVKKTRSDGTISRGDIHVLLVGDPGVAKSVALKFIASIAKKGRYIVGKGATGAGITATVVRDEFMKGWSLEAGAMVLSNKGTVCIDEIEKMDPEDRSALHEAMEQQTVTISKANVQAQLKAETSILAAANPKLGRFDPYKPISQQIDMPPTLINRFDVVFTLKDLPDKEKDEAIASHVLMEHKKQVNRNVIEKEVLRKYIAYAKQKCHPKLTDEATDEIKKFYVHLRNMQISSDELVKPIPISARQLEALIRLSEASARSRLSEKVTKEDAQRAIRLIKYYLRQVGFDPKTKTYDIDRIATGIPTSERSRIILVRETLGRLESRHGKLIPIDEIKKELAEKMNESEIDESIKKLAMSGDIFQPRKGFVQRV